MFYLTMHSTHFIYSYMASDIWLRTILIVRKETRCRHIGYSFWLTAMVFLYAPSHKEDSTYHGLCYTSCGALAGMRNRSMGSPHEGSIRWPIAPWANALTTELHLTPGSNQITGIHFLTYITNGIEHFIKCCIKSWVLFDLHPDNMLFARLQLVETILSDQWKSNWSLFSDFVSQVFLLWVFHNWKFFDKLISWLQWVSVPIFFLFHNHISIYIYFVSVYHTLPGGI